MSILNNWLMMVPLVSFLAALRILSEAQSCNNGLGRLVYEKVSDFKLTGSFGKQHAEVMTQSGLPIKVLEECIRRCQEDKTTSIDHCFSFDFAPGQRRSSPYPKIQNQHPLHGPPPIIAEYEESHCTLYDEKGAPDGNDALVRGENVWHFNEVCLNSNKLGTECPNRLYVFERIPGYKFEGITDKEVIAANRTECGDQCLSQTEFPCRSATFDKTSNKCWLSRETRYMNPRGFKTDPNADYLENMCLKRSQMCTSTAFILETNKELDGAYERELISANDFQECSNYCLNSLEDRGFLCRSFIFDDGGRICILYDEDPLFYGEIGQDPRSMSPTPRRPLKSSAGNLYRVLCVNSDRDRSANVPYNSPYGSPYGPASIHETSAWSSYNQRGGFGLDQRVPPGYPSYQSGPHYGSRHPGPGFGPSYPEIGSNTYPPGSPGGLQYGGSHPPHSVDHPPPPPPPPPGSGPPGLMPPMPSTPPFGIPYHSPLPGSPYPGGHPNAIGPGPPFMPPGPFSPDRCQFPAAGGPGGPAPFPAPIRFNRLGFFLRLRNMYITKVIRAERQEDCERACIEARDFTCRSFNYRSLFPAENCELSQYDSKQLKLDNPAHFEPNTQFDYFERDPFSSGMPGAPGAPSGYSADCLEVAQTCTPDGMEFTVKTPEGFYGRIYTYGFYDSCFYDGNGGTVNVLRISRANGFPRCGTQQYGDAMTNIVVVQFNDYVQTSRDKKYNLTCYFSGPGEAVVTSNYLDAKTDGRYPTQIEHLPAQNILTSNVVLRVLYRGTPTNTIVVGDLLTFKLEARGHYRYDYYNSDIFATNVIAKDPYTGRQVHLIDSRGCPVDLYVFPELHKTPEGALEAEFYAFKIPDSTFLVFQATVRSCRGPCEPVICTDRGRGHGTFPSWGRRKRDVDKQLLENKDSASNTGKGTTESVDENSQEEPDLESMETTEHVVEGTLEPIDPNDQKPENKTDAIPEEEVHELFRVYLSRAEIPAAEVPEAQVSLLGGKDSSPFKSLEDEVMGEMSSRSKVCVSYSSYYALVTAVTLLVSLVVAMGVAAVLLLKKSRIPSISQMKLFHLNNHHEASQNGSPRISSLPSSLFKSSPLSNLYVTPYIKSPNTSSTGNQKAGFPDDHNSHHLNSHQTVCTSDPPVYADPSLFERSRSLRSLTMIPSMDDSGHTKCTPSSYSK